MPTLDREDTVFVITLGDGENRFTPALLDEVGAMLDEVEATPGTALVTAGAGKQYSSGLDLAWMSDPANADGVPAYLARVERFLGRVLAFPAYTVAALVGHTFAAGAMLAAAHDARVMRRDRGYWCLPEVDLGLPFTPGMRVLLQAKVPVAGLNEAVLTGRRFGGPDALEAGLVDAVAEADAVLETAVATASAQAGKGREIVATMKRDFFGPAIEALGA
jgi:Delta3-Delta2-enoyl-CoA isomerase